MQLGFCYVKRQQIPLKRFLCLRKGEGSGGSTGTEPASQPRSGEGSPEPSGPTPPAAPSQKPSLPAGRGRPGGCGTGEGRRRFPTGAISHSGGPHLPGRRRQRERKVGASLRSISNELGKCWGRGGIRLRPPTAHLPRQARDVPGTCRPGRAHTEAPGDCRAGCGDALGDLQEEVTSGPLRRRSWAGSTSCHRVPGSGVPVTSSTAARPP